MCISMGKHRVRVPYIMCVASVNYIVVQIWQFYLYMDSKHILHAR